MFEGASGRSEATDGSRADKGAPLEVGVLWWGGRSAGAFRPGARGAAAPPWGVEPCARLLRVAQPRPGPALLFGAGMAFSSDGLAAVRVARPLSEVPRQAAVLAQHRRTHLENRLRTRRPIPVLVPTLHPAVELPHQRLHPTARHRQARPPVTRVVHPPRLFHKYLTSVTTRRGFCSSASGGARPQRSCQASNSASTSARPSSLRYAARNCNSAPPLPPSRTSRFP